MRKYLFIFLLVLPVFGWTDDDLDERQDPFLLDGSCEPSAIVEGVNTITGAFTLADLGVALTAPEPLVFGVTYNSRSEKDGGLGVGLSHNHPTSLKRISDPKEKCSQMGVEMAGGSFTHFFGEQGDFYTLYYLSPEMLDYGLTNSSGGRTSLKNWHLIHEKMAQTNFPWKLRAGDGSCRFYDKHFQLKQQHCSSGNSILYKYDFDDQLNSMTLKDRTGETTLGWMKLKRTKEHLEVTTSQNHNGIYTFEKVKGGERRLKSCRSTGRTGYSLGYDKDRISKLQFWDGRALIINYGSKRVHSLEKLGGVDQKPASQYEFEYHRSSRYTAVQDARGQKQIYRYNKQYCLTDIERYCGGIFYSTHQFVWQPKSKLHRGEIDLSGSGNLLAKVVRDSKGTSLCCTAYKYDTCGNVIEETIAGNLTHTSDSISPILVDDKCGYLKGGETYSRRSVYSQDRRNLLLEEHTEEGGSTYTSYVEGTHLVAKRLVVADERVYLREFYSYDSGGFMLIKICDNGSGDDEGDLTNVTERRITRRTPVVSYEQPGYGKAHIVQECYLDLETGREMQLQKRVFHFASGGVCVAEEVYDAEDILRYTLEYEYDSHHNVIMKKDPLGQVTRARYHYKMCVYEEEEGSGVHKEIVYDRENRPIAEKLIGEGGESFVNLLFYNAKGDCIQKIDPYGQATKMSFDLLGRKDALELPKVFSATGEAFNPKKKWQYNALDQVVCEINPRGEKTHKSYTSRGNVGHVVNPDGTQEECHYSLGGKPVFKKDSSGCTTTLAYDSLGRLVEENHFDASGVLMNGFVKRYSGNRVFEVEDTFAKRTSYTYDGAGRMVEECVTSVDGEVRRKAFLYDALGRQNETRLWFGEDEDAYSATLEEYDLLDRIVEKRIEGADGTIYSKKTFSYDRRGNVIAERSYRDGSHYDEIQTEYDCLGRPVRTIDAEGNVTTLQYNDNGRNAFGQTVLVVTTTDPLGRLTIETHDTHGRVAHKCQKDLFGELLSETSVSYDEMGNRVFEVHQVLFEGKQASDSFTIEWSYDPLNRLTKTVERGGGELTKETLQEYDARGRLETIVKPDGVKVFHSYDDSGRLVHLRASDASVDYRYYYDPQDHLIAVEDAILGEKMERNYDGFGQLIEEIGRGGGIKYAYDLQGRTRSVHLPNGASIKYEYDPISLIAVAKIDLQGLEEYRHTYTETDWQGKTLAAKMIDGSDMTQEWDSMGRMCQLKTPYWSETIPEGGFDAKGNLLAYRQTDFEAFEVSHRYDPLNQLTEESGPFTHTYGYDSMRNRRISDGTLHTINGLQQVVHDGKKRYTYDRNGNLTKSVGGGENHCYHYDALNRLVQVDGGTFRLCYTYDAFGRRTSKVSDKEKSYFLYQGEREIGACNSEGTLRELRVLGRSKGAELGAAVAMEIEGTTLLPIHNHKGDVCALIDLKRRVATEWYRYSAFGEVTVFDGRGTTCERATSPWLMSSKRTCPLTGFVHFGHRDYSPQLGRWITPDPAGFGDGPNLYQYVHNNPLIHCDPFGLWLSTLSYAFQGLRVGHLLLTGGMSEIAMQGLGMLIQQGAHHLLPDWSLARYGLEIFGSFIQGQSMPGFSALLYPVSGVIEGEGVKDCIVRVATGILTEPSGCEEFAKEVHGLLGGMFPVHWTCHPSRGLVTDLISAGANLYTGQETRGSIALAHDLFRDYVSLLERTDSPLIYLIAHSRAGVEAYLATQQLGDVICESISIATIGSAKIIEPSNFRSVINYINDNDIVPRCDFVARHAINKGGHVALTGYKSQGLVSGLTDHMLSSEGYRQALEMFTSQILEEQGVRK